MSRPLSFYIVGPSGAREPARRPPDRRFCDGAAARCDIFATSPSSSALSVLAPAILGAVADDDFKSVLARFDAHLGRTDELTARNTAAFERNTQAFERNTQAFERNARAWGKTISALDAIRESIEDMRDEIQANTRAILHMLDRLEGGGSEA